MPRRMQGLFLFCYVSGINCLVRAKNMFDDTKGGSFMDRDVSLRKFGLRDKLGYMAGNIGNDFTFTFASIFLLVFYTKVLGISSALVGTMFVIARFIDAFTDITMGRIVDRARPAADGKFKPWLRRMCAPVALSSFLMYQYAMAGASMTLRVVYMFVTYLLWSSIFYTSINIPYGSMASVISQEADERAALSTYRSVGSAIVNIIVGVGAPLILYSTDASGNQIVVGKSFTVLAGVFALLTVICYLICYFTTTERVRTYGHAEHEPLGFMQTVKTLLHSRALIGIILASVGILAAQLLNQSINQYLFIDYFKDKSGISVMSLLSMIPSLALAPFAVPLTRRFGKKELGVFGSFCGAVSCFLLFFLRTKSMWTYIIINFMGFLGFGIFNLIMWAIITDIIDDREVRSGRRDDGTIYAVYSFARKVGQALAGGLGGWTLSWIGFESSAQVQTEAVTNGIYTIATLIPALLYTLVGLSLLFIYPLNRGRVQQNISILKERWRG